MNSFEAKRGFLTFLILSGLIGGTSFMVNYVVTRPTTSNSQAALEVGNTALSTSFIPNTDLILLIGIPILTIGSIVTIIKQYQQRRKL